MDKQHKCFVPLKRDSDFIKGVNSPLVFKAVSSGNWFPYLKFFEDQNLQFETNGCVLFTAQETFDAQIENLIQNGQIDANTLALFTSLGYMDSNSLDGKPHFHSSPRFLQILTGNGLNGNPLQAPWDVMRKYGVLPWTDLPYDSTTTEVEYLNPIPQVLLDKAAQFLAAIGGKNAIQYHWVVANGMTDIPAMTASLPQAPLCIAVDVGSDWNVVQPSIPPPGTEAGHSIMNYQIDLQSDCWIYDHYEPNPKELLAGYPLPYALQAVIQITPPTPAPAAPAEMPATVAPATPTTIAPTEQNVTILTEIVALYQKILALLKPSKVGSDSQNTMTSIINWLKGKKTYILGWCGVVYAVSGFATGHLDSQTALGVVFASLSFMGLRNGVTTEIETLAAQLPDKTLPSQ